MMTLHDILNTINDMDKISIHSDSGYVLFDGVKEGLNAPVKKNIIRNYLENPVDRMRAYDGFLIIMLGAKD